MALKIPIPQLLGLGAGATLGFGVACDCQPPDWSQFPEFWQSDEETLEVPVDAAPWLLRPCDRQVAADDCALVVDGERIPVEATVVGADACPVGDEYSLYDQAIPTVIQTLRPAHPLPPGAFAVLDCAGDDERYTPEYYGFSGYDYYTGTAAPPALHVRAEQIPLAPPGDLDVLELHYTRNDEDYCISGDYLALRVDFDAEYLRQGGYVEVLYPDGKAFAVSRPTDVDDDADIALLPASRGPLSLTPVAIDGRRGETVVVDEDDMTEDLVYIPGCAVDPGRHDLTLLALAWLLLARRRRRSS